LGWQGLEEVSQLKGWTVQLNSDVCWVASPSELPLDGLDLSNERALLRLFLSADALGPQGRMQELRLRLLQSVQLNSFFSKEMALKGLSCDEVDEKKIGLCFPLSFLEEDLAGVAQLLSVKG
jgi:hypothetical protein